MHMSKKADPSQAEPAGMPVQARMIELNERRRVVIKRIIELETKGTLPAAAAAASTHAEALRLLSGESEPPKPVADPCAELAGLHRERSILDRALEIGRQKEAEETGDRVRALMVTETVEWQAAVRKRALLAIALQKANREFEVFRRRYVAVGGMPSGRWKLLGPGVGADEVRGCAEELIGLGILTRKECFDE
jgi:hypothetical protein